MCTYSTGGNYNKISYFCNGAVSGAWWFGKYHHTAVGYALVDLHDGGSVTNTYVTYGKKGQPAGCVTVADTFFRQ